ncbi:Phage-related minor tail protein [Paenibacillaceae bacterium GAS479]|nr:Phage-related minor tail protein [Paenibacillaceae bacterium GAS479]
MAKLTTMFALQDRMTRNLRKMKRNMDKMTEAAEQTRKQTRALERTRIKMKIHAQDLAGKKLKDIRKAADQLARKHPKVVARVNDKSTRVLKRIRSSAAALNKMRVTVTATVKDNATKVLNDIEAKAQAMQGAVIGAGVATGAAGAGAFYAGANSYENDARAAAITNSPVNDVTQRVNRIYYDQKVGSSREDVTRAYVDYSQQTDFAGGALDEATRISVQFAQLYQKDIPEVTRGFASAYKSQLGTMREIGDVSAAVMERAGDQYDDYLDTINEYGSSFKNLGMSIGNVGAVLVAAVEKGARNFDDPADMFREFNIRRKELTDEQIGAFREALGEKRTEEIFKRMDAGTFSGAGAMVELAQGLSKIQSITKRDQLATTMLGTKFEDVVEPMIAAAAAANDTIKATGQLDQQFNKFRDDNPMTPINDAMREMKRILVDIGKSMITSASPAFEDLAAWAKTDEGKKSIADFTKSVSALAATFTGALSKGIKWAVMNWGTLEPIILTLTAAFAGLFAAGKGVSIYKKLDPVFKGLWKGATWLWGAFVKLWKWIKPFIPWLGRAAVGGARFLPVIGWIVTAVLGLYEVWKNWDSIKQKLNDFWTIAKGWLNDIGVWIDRAAAKVETFLEGWRMLKQLKSELEPVFQFLAGWLETLSGKKISIGVDAPGFDARNIPGLITDGIKFINPLTPPSQKVPTNWMKLIPGAATGISDIPRDDMLFRLHKGETVLPAEEASLIRSMAGGRTQPGQGVGDINVYLTGDNHYNNGMDAERVGKEAVKAIRAELTLGLLTGAKGAYSG